MAIAGSFLIGLGFPPFQAATLCLIANTAPVAWGGVGNPIRVLAGVTGLPEMTLSAMTGRILPPLSLISCRAPATPVTPASTRIGLPTPPQATGAVLAIKHNVAA